MRTQENDKLEKSEATAGVNNCASVEKNENPEGATGRGINGVSARAQIYPDLSRIEYHIELSAERGGSRIYKTTYAQINMYEGSSLVTSFWMKNFGDCIVEANTVRILEGTITPSDLRYPGDMETIYNSTCYLDITSNGNMEHILIQKRP